MALSIGFQGFSSLLPCHPSYRALAFALVRLFLTEYASLPWTHEYASRSGALRVARTPTGIRRNATWDSISRLTLRAVVSQDRSTARVALVSTWPRAPASS